MLAAIYLLIGVLYADCTLIINMRMDSYYTEDLGIVVKLFCYLLDVMVWPPIVLITNIILPIYRRIRAD